MDNNLYFIELNNLISKNINSFRIGEGYDVHRLVTNRDLILGGVKIDYEFGLLGHSDADVLIHSIIDSILGAAGLGDIGKFFPDTEKEFEGISSLILLERVKKIISDENIINKKFEIINIDSTIICERPKLRPYIDEMRKKISNSLELNIDRINIKATTEEGLGFTGEKKGIASRSICLIREI